MTVKTAGVVAAAVAWCSIAAAASAQSLPSEPVSFGDGRVVLGGDVAATIAPVDPGFFSYGQYDHSTMREFRIGSTGIDILSGASTTEAARW